MGSPSSTLRVIEDGGLGALMGTGPKTSQHAASVLSAVRTPDTLKLVRDILFDELSQDLLDPVSPPAIRIPAVLAVLRKAIGEQVEAGEGALRTLPTDEQTLLGLYRDSLGWGPAQPYLDDERIQEVKINGAQIMVQEDGADFVMVPERFSAPELVLERAMVLASRLRVPLDMTHPQGTLPLPHGTRMHVTIPPCTPDGSALVCIRRGRRYAWSLDDVFRRGGFSAEIFQLLVLFARAKCSFLIAGETGSGKTALLESIVNSWPGQPHVITIEDNTLEIHVRHEAWTRELVQTSLERGAFGRAAREALRQTPTIVAPGEIRAEEAGAVLTIAVSGHAVISTLHAKSCAAAVQRFADCASMPGAYVYEGRRENALEDACDNLEVIIHVEKLSGRRYIREIALLDGSEQRGPMRSSRPRLVPLAEMVVDAQGTLTWKVQAVADGDTLRWLDGADATPAGLAQKLRLLRAERRVRAAPTTRAAVQDALERAHQCALAGQVDQAMHALRRAWTDRHDQRLIHAMATTLESDPARMGAAAAQSLLVADQIEARVQRRVWGEARELLATAESDLVLVAALTPAARWEQLRERIEAGLQQDGDLFARARQARQALEQGEHPQDVLALLGGETVDRCSVEATMLALAVRRDALTELVRRGEGGQEALEATEARMESLRALDMEVIGG